MAHINIEIISKKLIPGNKRKFSKAKLFEITSIDEDILSNPKFQEDLEDFINNWQKGE